VRKHGSRGRPAVANQYQNRNQKKILDPVVQYDRMPETVEVRELHSPAYIRNAAGDLTIDEIANSGNAHYVGAGDSQCIGYRPEFLPETPAEQPDT
jgi:hypothetical protein